MNTTIRLLILALAAMPAASWAAFPTIEARTGTQITSSVTSHSVNTGNPVDGETLVLMFTTFGSGTVTKSCPSGWTELYDDIGGNVAQGLGCVRDADGTEGSTVTVTTNFTRTSTAYVYRISGASGASDIEAATALDTASSWDPPSLNPADGADDTLWLAVGHTADDDQATTATASGYSNLQDAAHGAGTNNSARTAVAERELNADSEDPGSFTLASSEGVVAATIAVRPGGACVPCLLYYQRMIQQN